MRFGLQTLNNCDYLIGSSAVYTQVVLIVPAKDINTHSDLERECTQHIYVTMAEELTAAEKVAVDKLRASLSDVLVPDEHDDVFLVQWLRVKHGDIAKAEKMCRESLEWRKQHKIQYAYKNMTPSEIFTKYAPYAFIPGGAKDGTPVVLALVGIADGKGIMKSITDEALFNYFLYIFGLAQDQMNIQSEKVGRRIRQITLILDCEHLTLQKMAFKNGLESAMKFLKIMENNYPTILNTAYVINAPPVFNVAYKTVKPILSDITKEKIKIYGSDSSKWMPALLNVIADVDSLPKRWGGNKIDPDGNPKCPSMIPMNGKVPKSFYLASQREKLKSRDDLLKAQIKGGDSFRLEFNVTTPGSLLCWQFLTKEYPIGFGIQFADEQMELEYPIEIVESQHGVEDGEWICSRAGKYVVIFDNQHNPKHTTKLSYYFEVLPPNP